MNSKKPIQTKTSASLREKWLAMHERIPAQWRSDAPLERAQEVVDALLPFAKFFVPLYLTDVGHRQEYNAWLTNVGHLLRRDGVNEHILVAVYRNRRIHNRQLSVLHQYRPAVFRLLQTRMLLGTPKVSERQVNFERRVMMAFPME